MKRPERLVGFVSYEEYTFPFEFDEREFKVNLYPSNREVWRRYSSGALTLERLQQTIESSNEWISNRELSGRTSEGYRITFWVSNNYSSYHGFLSFPVAWYFIWEERYSSEAIDGFRIRGPEIDAFFPPESVFEYDIQPAKDSIRAKKITLSAECQNEVDGGKFLLSDGLTAEIKLHSYASVVRAQNPMTSQSYMTLQFSKTEALPGLLNAYEQLWRFFMYVTGRANVSLDNVEVFAYNQERKRDFFAWLCCRPRFTGETNKKAKDEIIDFSILGTKSADLLNVISAGLLDYEYLPRCIDEKRSYSVSRFIMILAAFEREFRNIYGIDAGRSEPFVKVKTEVVQLMENFCDEKTGKEREYAADLLNGIKNFSLGYWFNVKYALIDCREIMEAFTLRKYGTPQKPYKALAEEIGRRVGKLRNDLAHDKLNWDFEAVQISDIQVVEELIYSIRLKNIGLEPDKARRAIQKLFQEKNIQIKL